MGILYGDPSGNWPGLDVLASWEGVATGGRSSYFALNMPDGPDDGRSQKLDARMQNPSVDVTMSESDESKGFSGEISRLSSVARNAGPGSAQLGERLAVSGGPLAVSRQPLANLVFPLVAHGARDMISADALVRYDAKRYVLRDVRTTEQTEGFMVAATDKGGYVRISMAGIRKLNGDVTLLELVFGPATGAEAPAPSLKLQAPERDGNGGLEVTSEAAVGQRLAVGSSTSGAVGREPSAVSSESPADRGSATVPTEFALGAQPSAVSGKPMAEIVWLVLNEGASNVRGRTGEGAMGDEKKLPAVFYLAPPKPNPFGDGTSISFGLPFASAVRLSVFDAAGKKVRTLADGIQPAGRYSLVWDGSDSKGRRLANGVYFIRMKAPTFQLQRKVTLVRR